MPLVVVIAVEMNCSQIACMRMDHIPALFVSEVAKVNMGSAAAAFVTFHVWLAEAKCILVMCVCVSVSVCLSLAAFPHYCMDPDASQGNGRAAL